MANLRLISARLIAGRIGSNIALIAAILWTVSLPFSMAQTVRFTSIFLFSILGGFIISVLSDRTGKYRISRELFFRLIPLPVLALLPLLHFIPYGSNQRELVLLLPLVVIPWILFSFRNEWPFFFPKLLFASLLSSFLLLWFFQMLRKPVAIWYSVRSENEIPDLFLLARPQLGLLTGLMFFLTCSFIQLKKGYYLVATLFTLIFLYLILAKIAIISFLLVLLLLQILDLRKHPMRFMPVMALVISGFLVGLYFLFSTGFVSEALSRDGLSFERYPKAYVNSINSRVVLWKSSFQLLVEEKNWLIGLPSEKLGAALDEKVGQLNGYLETRHMNPHNQFLYMLLHYGIPGLLALLFFWFQVFRMVRKNRALTGLWLFAFFCSMTEIYLDREFGSQIFMLAFLFSAWSVSDEKPKHFSVHVA